MIFIFLSVFPTVCRYLDKLHTPIEKTVHFNPSPGGRHRLGQRYHSGKVINKRVICYLHLRMKDGVVEEVDEGVI